MPSKRGLLWQTQVSGEKLAYLDKYVIPSRIIDIGCGAGWYTRHLIAHGHTVSSIDLAPRIDEGASSHIACANVVALPFANRSFDTAVMFDVLEHVADESAALAEVARVTARRLILSVPSDDDRNLYNYGLSLLHHIDKTHVREYNPTRLKKSLVSHGFIVQDMTPSFATQMPLVTLEFFQHSWLSHQLRRITGMWISVLMHAGIVSNNIPGDWFCVADRR